MEYKEDVRTFLKHELSVFAVRSGQHKVKGQNKVKGQKIYLRVLKLTTELSMLIILPHVLLKQLRFVQKNLNWSVYM